MCSSRRFLSLLLCLAFCLLLAMPAAGAETGSAPSARSWEMHPDSKRQATAADINAFHSGLTVDAVESMQAVWVNPWEGDADGPDFSLAPIPIDPAYYPELTALLNGITLLENDGRANPGTGMGLKHYLAVTTQEATVKLCLTGSGSVFGTLGSASYLEMPEGKAEENYLQLVNKVDALPAVKRVQEENDAKLNAYLQIQELNYLREEGLLLLNGPAILPKPENPPALAVSAGEVAEYNLFQDGYWARVTKPEDQVKLLNLINSAPEGLNPSTDPMEGGKVLLQLRLQDGSKHEYQTSKTTRNLVADGRYCAAPTAAVIFDEALSGIVGTYPAGIAWLGSMNPQGIIRMNFGGEGKRPQSLERAVQPEELEAAVSRLRGLNLKGGTSRKVPHGQLPEPLKGKTASDWVRLQFENGISYQLNFYEGKQLTIDSSDMSFSYFYQCDRIEDTAG